MEKIIEVREWNFSKFCINFLFRKGQCLPSEYFDIYFYLLKRELNSLMFHGNVGGIDLENSKSKRWYLSSYLLKYIGVFF